ncbi:MAG TPA: hypothetical protein VHY30_05640 [Verrucomicrobiae bacterium]|jgi:hypothetical protein|nr:hypothetical protein [Verrucomicrobiae bacterium]
MDFWHSNTRITILSGDSSGRSGRSALFRSCLAGELFQDKSGADAELSIMSKNVTGMPAKRDTSDGKEMCNGNRRVQIGGFIWIYSKIKMKSHKSIMHLILASALLYSWQCGCDRQ